MNCFDVCLLCHQVALVYPNNEPISFICAFYGCLTAGVVPVPIEVPLTKRVGAVDVWVCTHAIRLTSLYSLFLL